jgi:uncharacterized membrane protein
MGLQQYGYLILIVTIVSALFVASPTIQKITVAPQTVFLTEFSILGPFHNSTYPYNIEANQNFKLYLEVKNHLGSLAYYQIEIKFRNQTQSGPDSLSHTSSDQSALGEIPFCVADNGTIELPIDVSLEFEVDQTNTHMLDVQNIVVNGEALSANATTIVWDPEKQGFYGNLFFELWIFNDSTNAFQYNQRYVSLWLNMTNNS